MTHKEFEAYILSLPGVWLDYPFGEGTAVYKFGRDNDGKGKIVAIVQEGSSPLRVSLKCDPLHNRHNLSFSIIARLKTSREVYKN